jgi:hypothetical protein
MARARLRSGRAGAGHERYPNGPGQPAFPTRNGTRQNPDNIRSRILAPIRDRANRQLEAEDRLPIAHMTPPTLRRTFASILAVCDVPPRRDLMGHTDRTLTLAVYQQVLDVGKGSVELLEQTLGCTPAAARAAYNGEATAAEILGASREPAPGKSPGRSRSNEPLATNGRAASQVSGTNPEPSAQDASPALRERAFGQQKTPPERGFSESG